MGGIRIWLSHVRIRGWSTLLDLYCGVGSIGIAISHLFEEIIGIELHEESILWARKNAEKNNVNGQWHAGPVEKVLPTLSFPSNSLILVDPPRAGLHPKAAKFLAAQETEKLVYVACSPASLARDALILMEGGWNPSTIWSVDLFPQTPHIETIALFTKNCSWTIFLHAACMHDLFVWYYAWRTNCKKKHLNSDRCTNPLQKNSGCECFLL